MSIKIDFEILMKTIKKALINAGMNEVKADICARVHTESSADGVESHGANRVPRFVDYIQKGWVNPDGDPILIRQRGFAENYDGNLGPGISNAIFCADRAAELAKEHGIGLVTLKNPFCVAVPREDGEIVLDMAMSQYAFGKLGVYRLAGKNLPYPGGFDEQGNLTYDPGSIEKTKRILPTGYWKGSSMALILDLLASALANGKTGADLDDEKRGSCTGCSQVFIAIDPYLFGEKEDIQNKWNTRVKRADSAHPIDPDSPVQSPGENTMKRRMESMKNGVNIDEQIWAQIQSIADGNLDVTDIS